MSVDGGCDADLNAVALDEVGRPLPQHVRQVDLSAAELRRRDEADADARAHPRAEGLRERRRRAQIAHLLKRARRGEGLCAHAVHRKLAREWRRQGESRRAEDLAPERVVRSRRAGETGGGVPLLAWPRAVRAEAPERVWPAEDEPIDEVRPRRIRRIFRAKRD